MLNSSKKCSILTARLWQTKENSDSLKCFFLVCFTSLELVDSIQYGVAQREEEEKGPLVSLLKSSADRVIANAPIIINRDSELYQRYWKQRLPRRASIKAILNSQEEDSENPKVQNEILLQEVLSLQQAQEEELNNLVPNGLIVEQVPNSLPLVQEQVPNNGRDDEDINNPVQVEDDNEALPSIRDETVIKQDQQFGQNQVSLSHDEPGTSLADQLAQLEVIEDEANESNYLPTGDLLRLPDGSRNYSSLLVKIKEQRQIKIPHINIINPSFHTSPAKSSVPQLTGQFVHAARYRSLPASRFDSSFSDDQPEKTERVDFSYKPLPEETPVPIPTGVLASVSEGHTGGLRIIPAPTGELGTISGSNGNLGAISTVPSGELGTKTVYSTNTFGFQDVKEALPTSQQLQQKQEPVQETLFRHQVENNSFEGTTASSHVASPYRTVVTPPTTTTPTVFITEPPFTVQQEPKQAENAALGQLYNGVYPTPPTPRPFEPLYSIPEEPVAPYSSPIPASQTAAAVIQTQYNVPPETAISYASYSLQTRPAEIRPTQNYETNPNYENYRPQSFHSESTTTTHPPLVYGFQPVTASKIPYQGSRYAPPPPVPAGYSGNVRGQQPSQPQQSHRTSLNSKHIRFPSFFYF